MLTSDDGLRPSAQLAPCSFAFNIFNDRLNKLVFCTIIRRTVHSIVITAAALKIPATFLFISRPLVYPACYVSWNTSEHFQAAPHKKSFGNSNTGDMLF